MNSAGDQVIPGAFRRALGQHRRFDLDKTPFIEEIPNDLDDAMPFDKMILHRGAPQVQVAILEPQLLAHRISSFDTGAGDHRLFGNGEGQESRFAQDGQIGGHNLDRDRSQGWDFRCPRNVFEPVLEGDTKFVLQRSGVLQDA